MNESIARKILGLASDANFRAAKIAYRNLVRIHHPDRAATDQAAQRLASERMSQINEAWEYLEQREKSGVFGQADGTTSSWQSSTDWIKYRNRNPDECELCGSTPAKKFDVRGLQQIIFRYALIGYRGTLCKSCAQSAGREALRTTLLQGWWGLFWFINYYFILALSIKLWVISRMKSPLFRDLRVITPFDVPLSPGKSPLRQPVPLFFFVGSLLLLGTSFVPSDSSVSPTPSSTNQSTGSSNTPTLKCWTEPNETGKVRVVGCNSFEAHLIELARVFDESRCPTWYLGTIKDEESGAFYCVGLKP